MAPTREDLTIQTSRSESLNADSQRQEVFEARSYQLEMLEESMKRNIIVAAETGSGKTFIASLRMRAELERCPPEKLVWFCVPTVALAVQQHRAISKQLSAFQARVLSGADDVDYWTEQWIWDEVLDNIRIVISTHQVLLEALGHGFVRMQQLALMVFDEAHSCIGNHPSSMILRRFYHKSPAEERPAILGLTASPVVNSKIGNLDTLETNLNAISRTPKLHREELLQYVHRPTLLPLMYTPNLPKLPGSLALQSLQDVHNGLDIEADPWIIKLRSDPETCDSKALTKALMTQKTYCHDQIKIFKDRAVAIRDELGESATDYYIQQCVLKYQKGAPDGPFALEDLEVEEKAYLRERLRGIRMPTQDDLIGKSSSMSPKVRTLIEFLGGQDSASFSGLIFVRTRAEVAVLSHLLYEHTPSFAISTFVGASSFSGRKNTIADLADVKNQKGTLDDLRYGRKNLIVTTNALEEGIDVSRCSIVICFDRPANLKSFIQRRGRARKSSSRFVMMFESGPQSEIVNTWTTLENEMRELYEDDMRRIQELQELETFENEDMGERTVSIEKTGAQLTLDDAVQHLYHFCATLPAAPYTDLRPIFTFNNHSSDPGMHSISASVDLPSSVDASVRHASSLSRWKTEKMAKRDAAFEAYRALYHAGLVNDNLLPLGHVDEDVDEAYAAVEKRPSLVEVSDQVNPWTLVAQRWQQSTDLQVSMVRVVDSAKFCVEMMLLLPSKIPDIDEICLHWDVSTVFKASVLNRKSIDPIVISPATEITSLLLKSIYRSRMDDRNDFTILFLPSDVEDFGHWAHVHKGVLKAANLRGANVSETTGLFRDLAKNGAPHVFLRHASAVDVLECVSVNPKPYEVTSIASSDSAGQNYKRQKVHPTCINGSMDFSQGNHPYTAGLLEVVKLTKKVDFLHHSSSQDARVAKESKTTVLPAEQCEMDLLPVRYAYFAMFIPSILHKIQIVLVVELLCKGILSPLHFQNSGYVTTAISASSANEASDYQRQEFLGDSILKFTTSLTLMARHLNYHEGILSHKKDHIVSNSSLASAAIKKGLDQYILTKPFTGRKWRPMYNGLMLDNQQQGKREMSSKTLADVVEALVGGAFLDGGQEKALCCLSIFLPHVPWLTPSEAHQTLYSEYDRNVPPSAAVAQIEQLINYQANLKLLLVEAITQASHRSSNSGASYERLEYLGDAVLDNIVTTTAFAYNPPIPIHRLHLLRTALVNGHFLGLLCLSLSILQRRANAVVDDRKNVSTIEVSHPFYLWQVMRHASPHISREQTACVERFAETKSQIADVLTNGDYYPWTALAQLEPPKFMSDMVESLLGAIYIDSSGSLPACESFLEHIGLMPYLRRVMETNVALLHPKEELGQLADRDKVKYELGAEVEEGVQRLTCKVIVGEREVAAVCRGRSKMEIETRAADAACRILRQEGTSVREGGNAFPVKVKMGAKEKEASGDDEEQ